MQIERYRGDTKPDKILLTKDGSPLDLTGCVVYMTLNSKKNPIDTADEIYQLIGSVSIPASGVVEFTPTDLQADKVGLFYFDIQVTDGVGNKLTIVKGVYQYIQDITKN